MVLHMVSMLIPRHTTDVVGAANFSILISSLVHAIKIRAIDMTDEL